MKLKLEPHNAKPIHGKEAWWYVDSEGITLACRIQRRYLANWLERTEP